MKKWFEILLTASVPGLMFCIDPWGGTPFRFSWQLAALWLGGVGFAFFLSSWWWRIFFFIALVRSATMPPAYDAYISLITIAVFLAAAEGFSRIDPDRVMDAMCGAALLLFCWVTAQWLGIASAPFAPTFAGPFNPDSGGVFFALCLRATLRPGRWPFAVLCLMGIAAAGATTAAISAVAVLAVFIYLQSKDPKRILAGAATLIVLLGLWFWRIDSIDNMLRSERWIAWKHAAWSMRSDAFGRGLGSWKVVFPLLASGDKRIGTVEASPGRVVMINYFEQAHNEYIQASFELGAQAALLMVLFVGCVIWKILIRTAPLNAAGGISAMMIACFGWHLFHVPPLAVLGVAWLGIWKGDPSHAGKSA